MKYIILSKSLSHSPAFSAEPAPTAAFQRVFSRFDVEAFEEILAAWIEQVVSLEEGEGAALDLL